jgi:cyclophilin family peptidyl-prolyl cis-trans isomerase
VCTIDDPYRKQECAGPNTNGCQFFFVTCEDASFLDGKHVVVGHVSAICRLYCRALPCLDPIAERSHVQTLLHNTSLPQHFLLVQVLDGMDTVFKISQVISTGQFRRIDLFANLT